MSGWLKRHGVLTRKEQLLILGILLILLCGLIVTQYRSRSGDEKNSAEAPP